MHFLNIRGQKESLVGGPPVHPALALDGHPRQDVPAAEMVKITKNVIKARLFIKGVGGCASGLKKWSQASLPASNLKMGLLEQIFGKVY